MLDGQINSMISNFSKTHTLKDGRTITLRYPQEDDAQRLVRYINPIVREPARILLNVEQTIEEEEKHLKDSLALIEKGDLVKIMAVVGDKIVGMTDVTRQRYKMRHIGLFGITISKTYRGAGLGKILIDEALVQAKIVLNLRKVILSVSTQNIPAVTLYKKMGFVQYGELPSAMFHDGAYEDEIFMYRDL